MGVWTVEPTEMVMVISSGRQLQVWCQLSKPVTYIYDVYEPLGQVLLVNLPQSTFGMHIQVTNVSPRTFKGQASVLSDLPGPVILRGAFKVGPLGQTWMDGSVLQPFAIHGNMPTT